MQYHLRITLPCDNLQSRPMWHVCLFVSLSLSLSLSLFACVCVWLCLRLSLSLSLSPLSLSLCVCVRSVLFVYVFSCHKTRAWHTCKTSITKYVASPARRWLFEIQTLSTAATRLKKLIEVMPPSSEAKHVFGSRVWRTVNEQDFLSSSYWFKKWFVTKTNSCVCVCVYMYVCVCVCVCKSCYVFRS